MDELTYHCLILGRLGHKVERSCVQQTVAEHVARFHFKLATHWHNARLMEIGDDAQVDGHTDDTEQGQNDEGGDHHDDAAAHRAALASVRVGRPCRARRGGNRVARVGR